ncbi:hypothetical protein GF373_07265, partial [bacterium]|nr:hypothetical protein [bacterium]
MIRKRYELMTILLFTICCMVFFVPDSCSQDLGENESCMECHGESDLVGEIDGEEVSVYVEMQAYENSVHGFFSCVDCHEDIEEIPHKWELKKVDCSICHEDPALEMTESVHGGEEKLVCADCHGDPHTMPYMDDEESVLSKVNVVKTCSACHQAPHEILSATGSEAVAMESFHGQILLQGNLEAANCADCHGSHSILSATHEESKMHHQNIAETCASCHEEAGEIYGNSIHAKSLEEGEADPASCSSCHAEHHIPNNPDAFPPMANKHIYAMCGQCHFDVALMDRYGLASAEQETLFKGSVHAEEVRAGNENAPTCVECHGYHEILALRNPESPSNFMNVAYTCGQCHNTEKEQWLESVHGESVFRGHKDAPVCTDCHGEHAILRPEEEESPVSPLNVSKNTCGRCHSSIVINDKYGIASQKVENYFDSYHGLATQHKSQRAANCASCHGVHLILPSDNPRSTVSKERLVETCGKCHPGIGDNVLAAPIHTDLTLRSEAIQAWVPRIYIVLILLIIGGMIVHNGIIFWALLRQKYAREKNMPTYTRFTTFEVVMHILLTVSFILLAVTGFALTTPNAWWVVMLSYLQMTEEVRAFLHRVGGVVLIGTSIIYGFYMISTRRGRMEFWAFFPKWSDAVHVFQFVGYHLGKRAEPPKFDRYDYTEKMEFWALVWGVIIM